MAIEAYRQSLVKTLHKLEVNHFSLHNRISVTNVWGLHPYAKASTLLKVGQGGHGFYCRSRSISTNNLSSTWRLGYGLRTLNTHPKEWATRFTGLAYVCMAYSVGHFVKKIFFGKIKWPSLNYFFGSN